MFISTHPVSRGMQAAAVAYTAQASIVVKSKTYHNRFQNQSCKTKKLNKPLKTVKVNSIAKQKSLSDQEIKETIVV